LRRIIVSTLTTLDGVVEDPGGFGGFEHGGWAGPYFNDAAVQRSLDHLSQCDYFLCGRHTYELFSKAWPNASGPYADRMNGIPKLVVSTTLTEPLTWNASLVKGDPIEELRKIKEEDGQDIMMYGSATLMLSLLRHDLVDELDLLLFPITIGTGKRLFGNGGHSSKFELVERSELDSGVVVLSYRQT
jgi:dihydrofolate reductase